MNKYSIFISSTIDDLYDARLGIDKELKATDIFTPVRVDDMPAIEDTSRHVCLKEVAAADAVVLIIQDRYGFIPEHNNPEKLSVTHLEYRHAKRLGKPVFAFFREGVDPESELNVFIQEVSDFDKGVLRKKWGSVEQLHNEVLRALLLWLARLARKTQNEKIREQVSRNLAFYPSITELSVFCDNGSNADESQNEWSNSLLEHLSINCEQRLLPTPRHQDCELGTSQPPILKLRIRAKAQKERLTIKLTLIVDNKESAFPFPIDIEVAKTFEGAQFAAQCSLALVLIAYDDWSSSIDEFLTASKSRNASNIVKFELIRVAAHISTINQGQKSTEVVQRILNLHTLDSPTVGAGIMALITAQLRLEHAQAWRALKEVEQLALELLLSALSQDQSSSEALYNLARQSLKYSGQVAITFYSELLRTNPSYDERWYFHRDLGLIYYNSKRYLDATRHYDQACHLKNNDSELLRFAGDAHYYQGYWANALIRYERAVKIEPIEVYFLDSKIAFSEAKISKGKDKDTGFRRRRNLSHLFSRVALKATNLKMHWLARPIFKIAKGICSMNFDTDRWLALYANRRCSYAEAIEHLKGSLTAVPEDPSARLNLVVNLLFQNEGQFNSDSRAHGKAAIFHGGPESLNQFRLRLINTVNRNELCKQFDEIFAMIKSEREEWIKRRQEVLKPEMFGEILHAEFRY